MFLSKNYMQDTKLGYEKALKHKINPVSHEINSIN